MTRKVLLIAYHFPPIKSSSGLQRTLKFARYLRDHDWESIVLSIDPSAYPSRSDDQLDEIPGGMQVRRAWGRDLQTQLSVAGWYPQWLALPDRRASWWFGAVPAGLRIIRRERPAVIWSTYPIATAHLIGLTLHRLTGLPWVADFRDTMTEVGYPPSRLQWRAYRWIERQAVKHSVRAIFTAPGALRMYRERYPDRPAVQAGEVIPNGFDEENFSAAARILDGAEGGATNPIRLVHSGLLYPVERDPRQFFAALGRLKAEGAIDATRLHVVLRATGHDDLYRRLLQEHGITDIVRLEPTLPYVEALAEMLTSEGLLLFQAANCNHQIPAKLYEYLRARRPILALTDPQGDTAAELRAAGVGLIAPLDDADAIARGLREFLGQVEAGTAPVLSDQAAARYSREGLTERLAATLSQVSASRA